MKRKVMWFLVFLIVLLVAFVGVWYYFFKSSPEVIEEVKVLETIEKYGYVLYENKTDLYKEKFEKLKEVLNNETIVEEDYALIISELFAADFYDLNSKVTNSDIGGIEFIYVPAKDNFSLAAKDTIYKYVENNVYGDRKQKLPIVKEATSKLVEGKCSYIKDDLKDDKCFKTTVDITYVENLSYPTKVDLVIVHVEEKLYITEVK